MTVQAVLRMGDPRLLQVAQPVEEFDTAELNQLITDMHDTIDAHAAAGLAATQIGRSESVMIFKTGRDNTNRTYPFMVLINPHIEIIGSEINTDWEGCLSVPGMRGQVPRYNRIRYTGYDAEGNPVAAEVEGFHARVVQHEYDHLNGIVYPMRMTDMQQFGFLDELIHSGRYRLQPCDD